MTIHRILRPLVLLLCAAPLACSGGAAAVDCKTVTVAKYSEMTAWAKCTNCHSSTLTGAARAGATVGIDFDKVETARMHAAKAMDEVYEGAMPLAGSPALTEAEKTQIYNWASCDTPN